MMKYNSGGGGGGGGDLESKEDNDANGDCMGACWGITWTNESTGTKPFRIEVLRTITSKSHNRVVPFLTISPHFPPFVWFQPLVPKTTYDSMTT